MPRFTPIATPFQDVVELSRTFFADERGGFSRLFDADELSAYGWHGMIAQVNHSVTRHKGTVRGMHFQYPPYAETKLVTCLSGVIWDVVVDCRPTSSSFLHYYATELSADNRRSLLIPAGFAHGFQALSDDVAMIYCHSMPYVAESEGGFRVDDPNLGIDWPLPIKHLSPRDQAHSLLDDTYIARLTRYFRHRN